MKKAKRVVFSLLLMAFALLTVASAFELWPGLFKKSDPAPISAPDQTSGPMHPAVEPLTVLLLGAGLVSLAIYAKRKHGKQL
jgi:hypothetical protein